MTVKLPQETKQVWDDTKGSAISPTSGKRNFDKTRKALGFTLRNLKPDSSDPPTTRQESNKTKCNNKK